MKSKNLVIIVVVALVVIAGIITGSLLLLKNTQNDAATTTTIEHDHSDHEHEHSHDATDQPTGEVVTIDNMATTVVFSGTSFSPQNISVKKGTVITVKNESQRTVQFSSGSHPDHNANPEMNLDALEPGESATYTATNVGTWQYHDHLDANIFGYVTVREQ